MDFYISATTDVGIKRKVNQDSLFVRKLSTESGKMVFAVLCDGMGGLKYGEVASASIVRGFSEWMYQSLPELSRRPIEDAVIREQWTSLISLQNDKIRLFGRKNNCVAGSTVTAMLLTEQRYFLLHIGDTRAYVLDNGIRQLTEDHTVAARECALGNLTREQAEQSPMRSVLTKCVGVKEAVYPDLAFGNTVRGAVYLLCSDGFRHRVTPEEIREHMFVKTEEDILKMKYQEELLIECNKSRGETDNISVITVLAC